MSQQSLKDKTIKGTMWSAADAFLGQGVTFLVGIVLARLLSPEEYGLIGICLIFTTVLNGIVDSGFSNALIRKKYVTDVDYNTMFITNMSISILLYVLLYLSAPFVAFFFARPQLTELVRVVGLVLFPNALSIIQNTILPKRIDFKTKTKASFVSALISGIIGVIMALYGFGVWSLVVQLLLNQLMMTVFLWGMNKWYPSFSFSFFSFRYMWGFGWKLMLSGLINNIWSQLYQVVIGKCYTTSTLGHYTRAQQYSGLPSSGITKIIQRVSYPVLSELQYDQSKMVEGYRKVIKITMFITSFCMIILAAISEPLLNCMIGTKWHEAATYMPFICISMSFYPLHAINLNMLQVLGRSDVFLYLEIIKKIVGTISLIVGIYIGIYFMLLCSIIAGFISLYLNSWYTSKSLGYGLKQQLIDISYSYLLSLIIASLIYLYKYMPCSNYVILFAQIISATIFFIVINEKKRPYEYIELKKILKQEYIILKNKIKKYEDSTYI